MTGADLRQMVREVLREALPEKSRGTAAIEAVRLSNDHELQGFITRLMEPGVAERVKSGALRFTLGAVPVSSPAAMTALTGVVSEKVVDRNAASGTLVLSADAVLTPLGRDRARKLGLKIERRR